MVPLIFMVGFCWELCTAVAPELLEGCCVPCWTEGFKLSLTIISGSGAKPDCSTAISGGCPLTVNICAELLPAICSMRIVISLPIFKKKLLAKVISPLSVRNTGLPPESRFIIKPLMIEPGCKLPSDPWAVELPVTCGCWMPLTVCGGSIVIRRRSAIVQLLVAIHFCISFMEIRAASLAAVQCGAFNNIDFWLRMVAFTLLSRRIMPISGGEMPRKFEHALLIA